MLVVCDGQVFVCVCVFVCCFFCLFVFFFFFFFCFFFWGGGGKLLAYLSRRLKVSYCDWSSSVVSRASVRLSSVNFFFIRNLLLKSLLLQSGTGRKTFHAKSMSFWKE